MVIKLVRGLECKWNRLERKAWMWCDASLYHELQCHWPTEPYPPCETVPPRETVSA